MAEEIEELRATRFELVDGNGAEPPGNQAATGDTDWDSGPTHEGAVLGVAEQDDEGRRDGRERDQEEGDEGLAGVVGAGEQIAGAAGGLGDGSGADCRNPDRDAGGTTKLGGEDRHGLVVIIALGESIVSVGVGTASLELDAGIVTAAVLSIIVVAGLWWAYFDVVTLVAEHRLSAATGTERAELARDAYSGFHIPIVAGIILVALGLKKTLSHVGDPLDVIPAFTLCGGVALYLLGHTGFRWRMAGSISRERLVTVLHCLLLIAAAGEIAALATLAILAALLGGLAVFETVTAASIRREVRAHEAR